MNKQYYMSLKIVKFAKCINDIHAYKDSLGRIYDYFLKKPLSAKWLKNANVMNNGSSNGIA
jgi:hypothetical protein